MSDEPTSKGPPEAVAETAAAASVNLGHELALRERELAALRDALETERADAQAARSTMEVQLREAKRSAAMRAKLESALAEQREERARLLADYERGVARMAALRLASCSWTSMVDRAAWASARSASSASRRAASSRSRRASSCPRFTGSAAAVSATVSGGPLLVGSSLTLGLALGGPQPARGGS